MRHAGDIFAKLHLIDPIARTAKIAGWDGLVPTVNQAGGAESVKVRIPLGDASEWRTALAALETDAATSLPGEGK